MFQNEIFQITDEGEEQIPCDSDLCGSTRRVNTFAVNTFRDYLQQKGESIEFEKMPTQQLAEVLKKFYVEARRTNGELYKSTALIGIRSGINRHLQTKGTGVDILNHQAFIEANNIFQAQKVELKRKGKSVVCISPRRAMYSYIYNELYIMFFIFFTLRFYVK